MHIFIEGMWREHLEQNSIIVSGTSLVKDVIVIQPSSLRADFSILYKKKKQKEKKNIYKYLYVYIQVENRLREQSSDIYRSSFLEIILLQYFCLETYLSIVKRFFLHSNSLYQSMLFFMKAI